LASVVEALIPGGKASAGPPLGPALGPLGVNVAEIVSKINDMTKDLDGMQVPVKLIVKSRTEYEVEIGTPPTSALLLKEAGIDKGTSDGGVVGDLTMEQILKVVSIKRDGLLSKSVKNAVREVVGTCRTMGITIDGRSSKEIQKAILEGEFDDRFEEPTA
jgi:large subunit ribosomal protein L11